MSLSPVLFSFPPFALCSTTHYSCNVPPSSSIANTAEFFGFFLLPLMEIWPRVAFLDMGNSLSRMDPAQRRLPEVEASWSFPPLCSSCDFFFRCFFFLRSFSALVHLRIFLRDRCRDVCFSQFFFSQEFHSELAIGVWSPPFCFAPAFPGIDFLFRIFSFPRSLLSPAELQSSDECYETWLDCLAFSKFFFQIRP